MIISGRMWFVGLLATLVIFCDITGSFFPARKLWLGQKLLKRKIIFLWLWKSNKMQRQIRHRPRACVEFMSSCCFKWYIRLAGWLFVQISDSIKNTKLAFGRWIITWWVILHGLSPFMRFAIWKERSEHTEEERWKGS